MNLFEELNKIMVANTDVTIVVRKLTDEKMTVSVNFRNEAVKDEAKNLLQPFIVSGSPVELDGGFVAEISKPLAESVGLQSKMQEFEAAKKVAEAKSAAMAEQKKKEEAEKKSRKEAYDKAMDAAKKAQDERKWKEAISALQKALEVAEPDKKAKIEEGIRWCKEQDVPDLFSMGGDAGEEAPAEAEVHEVADEQTGEVIATDAPEEESEEQEEEEEKDDLPE